LLEDKLNIIDTITRMAATADRKDWEGCLATFTQEVLLDHDAGSGRPEHVKSSDMVAGWQKAFDRFDSTWHSVTNHQVSIDGSHAVCKSYVHAIHCDFTVKRGANHYTEYGIYSHELDKVGNEWKISGIQYRMITAEGNSTIFPHEHS
jgi:hypothetical protein